MIGRLALAALAAAFWLPASALAQVSQLSTTTPTIPEASIGQTLIAGAGGQLTGSGDPDEDAVLKATADLKTRGYDSLGDHVAALRQVLADMPRPFVREQTVGGRLVYRADSMAGCVAFATTLKGRDGASAREFDCKGNPYAVAAFYLGSYLNETGHYEDAIGVLDQGLEASPTSPGLITERNAGLMQLRRWDEVRGASQRRLEIPNLAPDDHARLLRNLGYALTELQDLDGAEAVYKQSLDLDPGNKLAQHELAY